MVNGSNTVDQLGVVFCQFQLPQGADRSKDIEIDQVGRA